MAQITEKILEIKTKVEGANSVNDLKEQIAELTRLMDTLDKESTEYAETVNMLVDAEEELTNVMKVGKSQLSAQEGSYNALVNRMAALKKAHKAVTDETTRNRLSEEINKINTQLKEMDASNGVYVRNVGNYENAIKSALKTPQQELKALRVQLAQLTEGTAEYNAVFSRMAQLTHDVTEQQEQLKWASSDLGDILGNVAGVATSLAGGFSAFNALTSLVGGESEELEKAMLQAQRFIQLIQGLEQLEQLGDKISGLWKGIKNFSDKTQTAAIALTDFSNKTETAENAMMGANRATSTSAAIAGQAAEATERHAIAQRELNETDLEAIRLHEIKKQKEEDELARLQELAAIEGSNDKKLQQKIKNNKKEIQYHEQKIASIKKGTTATQTNTTATQANTVATNAQSSANVVAATTTGLFSKALGVLKTALISTGIGAIIVAIGSLIALLGNGLSALWDWISGADKAAETTSKLKDDIEHLNNMLEINERFWNRRELLLKAQGATEEELYQEERKAIEAKLLRVQALLRENEAIAANIGAKKLQKKAYDEFRETLEELREQERTLRIELEDFDWEAYCKKIEAARKENEKKAEAQRKAAETAAAAYNKEKESAEKLYKDLVQYYKDERTKLDEKYKEEKALLEKFGKDTTNLTRKYEEEKTKLVLKEEDARKKLREQFNKDFDASFRNPSIEYFTNQLDNATEKLEDFKAVKDTIKVDEQGFLSAENWTENIKYLNETYDVSIQNMEHFDLIFKKVIMDYEDAKKALEDYQKQLAKEKSDKRVDEIEKEINALDTLLEYKVRQKELEYELYASQDKLFGKDGNNYITQMKLRWEVEDSIFQMKKENLEKEIALQKAAANDARLTEEARLDALRTAAELERQLQVETTEHTIAQNQRKREAAENYVTAVQDSLDGISSILSNVATAWETSIQAQVDAGEISEEEGEKQMENMREIQSAIALINAFSSAVSAFNSMASIPFVGTALGAAAAAAALASGLMQVKAINAVKKGDKDGNTRYAEVTPTVPSDYSPTAVTNVTGGQETEHLANAMMNTPIWVSVQDIDSAQSRVQTRDRETSF